MLEYIIGYMRYAKRHNLRPFLTEIDLYKEITHVRKEFPEYAAIPAHLLRGTAKRLSDAMKKFFKMKKEKKKGGFPRFKAKHQWKSFSFQEFSGITFKDGKLYSKAWVGGLTVHLHREMSSDVIITSCNLLKKGKHWKVTFFTKEYIADVTKPVTKACFLEDKYNTIPNYLFLLEFKS